MKIEEPLILFTVQYILHCTLMEMDGFGLKLKLKWIGSRLLSLKSIWTLSIEWNMYRMEIVALAFPFPFHLPIHFFTRSYGKVGGGGGERVGGRIHICCFKWSTSKISKSTIHTHAHSLSILYYVHSESMEI